MNNLVVGLKKFFTNKNVVTILGVLLVLVILFFGYTSSIKKETKPVIVPVANKKITPETEITQEDIQYIKVPSSMISQNVEKAGANVIGKYTNINVTVPAGSMFYTDWLVEENKLPGNWIELLDYDAGELGYYMDVNIEETLGNSVKPNSYIDIYMKAEAEDETIMFGKLLKNVKVLVVHDSTGADVFRDAEKIGTPAKIGFAVSQDLYVLLQKASALNLELIIAPRGKTVPNEEGIVVTSATLRDYIDTKATTIEEDVIDEPNEELNEEPIEGDQNIEILE